MNIPKSLLAYCLDLDDQSDATFLSDMISECGADIHSEPFYDWLKEYSLTTRSFEETLESRLGRILYDYFLEHHTLMRPDAILHELKQLNADPTHIASYEKLFADLTSIRRTRPQFEYLKNKIKEDRLGGEMSGIALNLVEKLEGHKTLEAYEELRRQIFRLDPHTRERGRSRSLQDLSAHAFETYLDGKENPDKYKGIHCGIKELDKATNGFLPGEIILFSARTGVGKSLVLLHIAKYAWENQLNVLFCTREMTVEQQFYRLNVIRLGERTNLQGGGYFDAYMLRDFRLDASQEADYQKLLEDYDNSSGQIIFVPPERCASPVLIDIEIDILNSQDVRIDMVVIDYLQILNPSFNNDRLSKPERLGAIAWELKFLSQRRNCPIVTAMQDNRGAVADPNSGVETIAWSDDVPGVADLVCRIQTNSELEEQNKLLFRAVKGRNISLIEFPMDFHRERLWIGNPDKTSQDFDDAPPDLTDVEGLEDFPASW